MAVKVTYSAPGDVVALINESGEETPPLNRVTEKNEDASVIVWRHPETGKWLLVELLGWGDRTPKEWREEVPGDVPMDDVLLGEIERVRKRGLEEFARSGRLPGYCRT